MTRPLTFQEAAILAYLSRNRHLSAGKKEEMMGPLSPDAREIALELRLENGQEKG